MYRLLQLVYSFLMVTSGIRVVTLSKRAGKRNTMDIYIGRLNCVDMPMSSAMPIDKDKLDAIANITYRLKVNFRFSYSK